MEKLQEVILVIGAVSWTTLVCWCVYYITHEWQSKDK